MRLFGVLLLVIGVVGCNSGVKLTESPVSVSGKVSRGGQLHGGVVLVFQPLADGHVREVAIGKDGSFRSDMIPGEYAYYLAKPAGRGVAKASTGFAPKLFEADLTRTVTVEPGKPLAIALD